MFGKKKSNFHFKKEKHLTKKHFDRSYGVVLWELLTRETPYRDHIKEAIAYGVGSNKLQLHLPRTIPPGFLQLMEMCRNKIARKRPSFSTILTHLSNVSAELVEQEPENYANLQLEWRKEIRPLTSNRNESSHSTISTSRELETMELSNDDYNQNDYDCVDGENPFVKRLADIKHVDEIEDLIKEKMTELMQSDVYKEVAYLTAILNNFQIKPKNKQM